MHRMTQFQNSCQLRRSGDPNHPWPWIFAATLSAVLALTGTAAAQTFSPHGPGATYDFEASGYVVPAGMMPPELYPASRPYASGIAPVGYTAGCDAGCCSGGDFGGHYGDTGAFPEMGGYGSEMGGYGCYGECDCGSPLGSGGLLGRLRGSCLGSARSVGGGFDDLCHLFGGIPLTLGCLLPYTDAGRCAQRWYDLSAEATFLGHNRVGPSGTVTTLGTGPGDPVLDLASVGSTGLEAGFRLSAAMILGPGGNLEVTYIGSNEWHERASVSDPNAGLFSFVSEFGTVPINGFDDTDRSLEQSLDMTSTFHSGEVNYRRRTVGPNCRFQGSWLVGLRYIRYDNGLLYSALGENNNTVNQNLPRFFSSNDSVKNNLAGAQIGGDLWWNVIPGISVGTGVKGAWLNNDIDRRTTLTANSLVNGGILSVDRGGNDSTVAGEFETTLIYRLSHSWSFRSSYYLLAIEDVAVGTTDAQTIQGFVQAGPAAQPALVFDRLVIQGVTFGAEYLW